MYQVLYFIVLNHTEVVCSVQGHFPIFMSTADIRKVLNLARKQLYIHYMLCDLKKLKYISLIIFV